MRPDFPVVLAALCAGAWFGFAWQRFIGRYKPGAAFFGPLVSGRRLLATLSVLMIGMGGAVLAAPSIWRRAFAFYEGDSLFTLEPIEIASVLAISTVLILAFFWLATALLVPVFSRWGGSAAGRIILVPPALALVWLLLALAHSSSPQIYYTYYRATLDGLPPQWVIKDWIDIEAMITAARLPADGSLSIHLTGLVFWSVPVLVLATAALRWRPQVWQPSGFQVGMAGTCLVLGLSVLGPKVFGGPTP